MCLWQLWWQPGSTRTHTHAHNSPACLRSRFISLRLPPTLIIWVLRSLQGSYAPHALPNNPLVATSPHIVCNLSHCSVHVRTTIFDSLSLSLSLSTYVLHSRSHRCNLCNSTRLYIVRSFFLFFFFFIRFFSVSRVVTPIPFVVLQGELIAAGESYEARYRVRYKEVYCISRWCLDPRWNEWLLSLPLSVSLYIYVEKMPGSIIVLRSCFCASLLCAWLVENVGDRGD